MIKDDDARLDLKSFFQSFDENFQIGPQPVEALIPLNPMRMPAHIMATDLSDNMRNGKDSLLRPFENIQISLEYLSSSQSDAHYNSRFGQIVHDTAIFNLLAECWPNARW